MDGHVNIILFTTDQHRGDYIGLADNPQIETPNLDAFMRNGAYFPNAYSEIPSTTGARRVMLGGQKSHTCGLVGYQGSEWMERNTIAQVLADAGYHCINVGWRNLHPRRKLYGFHTVVPHDLSYENDEYQQWLTRELGEYAHERTHGSDANGWIGRPWDLEERYHSTNWTVAESLRQLDKRDPTKPFFLWCSHMRPHSPYDPPEFFWDIYMNREPEQPYVGSWVDPDVSEQPGVDRTAYRARLTPEQYRRMRAGYMGCITHIDYQLGYMQEVLTRAGVWRSTLVIFVADHGDMMGDHLLLRKSYAYEGSARVPFVIKYPDSWDLQTGTFDHVVGLQDIMPTCLEAAGVEIPGTVTGSSVISAVRGGKWREYIHGEHSPCYAPDNACHYLTDGREKYIWNPVTGAEQFFDLTKDRRELDDLSGSVHTRERVELWRKRLVDTLAGRSDGFSDGEKLITKPDGYGPEVV